MSAPPIEFRTTQLGATVAVLQVIEPPALADAMHKMLGGMPDFFNGEALILDFSALAHSPENVDWAGLNSLMRRFRLQPVGVIGLPEEHAAGARRAGLAELDTVLEAEPTTPPPAAGPKTIQATGSSQIHPNQIHPNQTHATHPAHPQPAPQPAPEIGPAPAPGQAAAKAVLTPEASPQGLDTVFVDRMLRSGQQVYARDANLVVVGGVNAGAEIIADGSILCYGPLLGRAIAGARGLEQVRIMSTHFGPELISIAGIFRTFERGIPAEFGGRAVQVRLQASDGKLTIDPLPLD